MADTVANVNQQIVSYFAGVNFVNTIGWIIFAVIVIAFAFYGIHWWNISRKFKKKVTAFDIVGINFVPSLRDKARTVKLGKGGFEILYLRKLKTWKLAYGGRVGKDTYYFFIMPDGYWYNGMLGANIHKIGKDGGLVPIVTTNPTMRSQYTALEKQIDSLHQDKVSFMEKYGVWVFSIGFLVIAGVFLWLNYKQFVIATSNLNSAIQQVANLLKEVNQLAGNVQAGGGSGLVPA
jgi:hypothetical protein